MTIPLSTPSYDHYSGDNTLSVYPITFPTYEASTIEVYITNLAGWSQLTGELLTGLELYNLVLDTDYSLQNINRPNTTVTLIDGGQDYLDGSGFLAAGYFLFVEFISNPMRPSALSSGNQLVPALTKDLDRLTMHMKALDHKMDEGFRDVINMQTDNGASGLLPPTTTAGEYLESDGSEWLGQSGLFEGFSLRYSTALSLASIRDALLYIFNFGYLAPTISLSCSPAQTVREKGDPVAAVTMSATTVKNTNDILAVRHYRNGVLVDTEAAPAAAGGLETFVESTPFSDNMSFYSRVDDDTTTDIQSNTVSYVFVYPYYSDAGAVGLSAANVALLTKDIRVSTASLNKTFTTLNGEVYFFAYPASYGALTSILDENGFETFGDWTLRTENITGLDASAVSYRIYEFNNPVVAGSTNYTFVR
jgi:hypothetical protein